MPAPERASLRLSLVFLRLRRGHLHYNRPVCDFVHPVLKLLANLCFDSGQTKLAARG